MIGLKPRSGSWTPRRRDRIALLAGIGFCLAWPLEFIWSVSRGAQPFAGQLMSLALASLGLFCAFYMWRKDASQRGKIEQLRESRDRLSLCLWASDSVFWDWDVTRDVFHRTGQSSERDGEVQGSDWRANAVHPDDLPALELSVRRHLTGETAEFMIDHRLRGNDGQYRWVRSRGKVVARDSAGKATRVAGTAMDIGGIREREQQHLIAQEALHSIAEGVIVMHANGQVRTVNPAFERMSEYAAVDLPKLSWERLGSNRLEASLMNNLLRRTIDLGAWSGELWLQKRSGSDFFVAAELSMIPERAGAPASVVAVLNDLTEKKRAEIELKHLTNFDPLTGLPNRMMFIAALARSLTRLQNGGRQIGLIFLNVDRFAQINESLGHGGGDELLRTLSLRIANNVRDLDSVARFGGDEFVVMLDGLESLDEGLNICARIQRALKDSVQVYGEELAVTASIGLAIAPHHGELADQLLRAAVGAMHVVKAMGGDGTHLSRGNDEAAARERIAMETALRRALEREEFVLHYQPILGLQTKEIVRFEVLLRWSNRQFGQVPPDRFIPILEQTGLIAPVGEWVLNEALSQLQRWRWEGFDVSVAVNISPIQLTRGNLPAVLPTLLNRFEIPGAKLELELTESLVMADPEHSIALLNQFRELGITIAIDDFGTGYSSLSYLKRLPIQKLKIDKAFIRNLTSDPNDAAIIDTILAMARVLKLETVAEGVESKAQLEYLDAQGCSEIQGYFIARPLAPEGVRELLQRDREVAGSVRRKT